MLKEKTARLSRKQFAALCAALRHYGTELKRVPDRERLRVLAMFVRALPTCAPYTVTISQREWPIVSRALRPEGSKPTPGTDTARWFGLYQTFIKPQYFGGLRVLSARTQREHRQRIDAVLRAERRKAL